MVRLKLSQMTIQGHEASTPEQETLPNAFHHYIFVLSLLKTTASIS